MKKIHPAISQSGTIYGRFGGTTPRQLNNIYTLMSVQIFPHAVQAPTVEEACSIVCYLIGVTGEGERFLRHVEK